MKVLIENQIFSPGYVFAHYAKTGQVLLEGHENYQKRSYRNRYMIQTSSGILALSIPLKKGKHQQMPIQEVAIAYDENWPKQHGHTIRSAYGNSPYFEYYYHDIQEIVESGIQHLFDFNLHALKKIALLMKWRPTIEVSDTFMRNENPDILNLKNKQLKPLEIQLPVSPYPQVWSKPGTFVQHLSILDTLFCCGPETLPTLKIMYDNQVIF